MHKVLHLFLHFSRFCFYIIHLKKTSTFICPNIFGLLSKLDVHRTDFSAFRRFSFYLEVDVLLGVVLDCLYFYKIFTYICIHVLLICLLFVYLVFIIDLFFFRCKSAFYAIQK